MLAFGDNVSYADAMVIMVVTVTIALLGVEGTVQHHKEYICHVRLAYQPPASSTFLSE
jgi:hypothetical protein